MAANDSRLLRLIKVSLGRRFSLHVDQANEADILTSIKKSTDFVGPNLWTLIFAIFIASIGLNVNSTAVVIGAMLISPLMGPITGVGVGLGINDFDLVKRGARNLFIATIISILTSSLYFWITPLHHAQSELLSRTTPSLWDVFIALFGGLAGIVGVTRKEKGNVIPGVAIATALMPPLCTAGYGIATGNFLYFIGALYLYTINSIFICTSSFFVVRLLNFSKKHFEDKKTERRVSRYIWIILVITVLPSIYLAYFIVDKSIFSNNAETFVQREFNFKNTQVVSKKYKYDRKQKEIELLLIGYELPSASLDTIKNHLENYGLKNTKLVIHQGLNAKQEIDFSQIKASILEDVFAKDSANKYYDNPNPDIGTYPDIKAEMMALYPKLIYYTAGRVVLYPADSSRTDTMTLVVAKFDRFVNRDEKQKMNDWLKVRLKADSLKLLLE